MRILVLSNLYPPDVVGGYELVARDVVEILRARGHTVEVLCTGNGAEQEGVSRTLFLMRPFGEPLGRDRLRAAYTGLRNVAAVRRYLRLHGKPDVALAMSQRRLGLDALRALGQEGIPIVVTVNDDWPLAYCRAEAKGLVGMLTSVVDSSVSRHYTWWDVRVNGAVYLSATARDVALKAGTPLPPGVIVPQGVDRRSFFPRARRALSDPLRLLFVGRLHPTKGPEAAIETIAALRDRGVKAILRVAGGAHTRQYGESLTRLADRLGVSASIEWLGVVERSKLDAVYRDADFFLFPSTFDLEGQGLTYLEAMSCGVPVVAHPRGGARDILEGSGAATIVPRCDGESFADGVVELMRDEAKRELQTSRAFRLLDEQASLDRYVDTVEAELAAAIKAGPSKAPASWPH